MKDLEVGSVASFSSVDSQTSCLSGHGGPHCFLPSHLFHALQFGDEFPVASLVLAQDKVKLLPSKAVFSFIGSLNVVLLELHSSVKTI